MTTQVSEVRKLRVKMHGNHSKFLLGEDPQTTFSLDYIEFLILIMDGNLSCVQNRTSIFPRTTPGVLLY